MDWWSPSAAIALGAFGVIDESAAIALGAFGVIDESAGAVCDAEGHTAWPRSRAARS